MLPKERKKKKRKAIVYSGCQERAAVTTVRFQLTHSNLVV